MDPIMQFLGRTHPLVLHVPIGVLVGLIAVEVLAFVGKRPVEAGTRLTLAWLGALSAVMAAVSGLLLAREATYGGPTVQTHQWLGLGVAASALLAAMCAGKRGKLLYGVFLVMAAGLMVPAGHLGAGMTHGEDFLLEPFHRRGPETVMNAPDVPAVPDAAASQTEGTQGPRTNPALSFSRDILPVFESKCVSCHAEAKRKGGLALHSLAALMEGGDLGPVLTPGDAASSDLVQRLRLPAEHDDHMPPKAKPQLTAGEIETIERWVSEGAKE